MVKIFFSDFCTNVSRMLIVFCMKDIKRRSTSATFSFSEASQNTSDIEDAEFFYEYMRDAPENKLKYFREKGTELNIEPDKVRNRINRMQRKLAKGISKEDF